MTRIDTSPATLRALADEWPRQGTFAGAAQHRGRAMADALRAWIDDKFEWGRSVCFYDSGNEREGEPACGWVWSIDDCSDSVAEAPTHWRPLPSAPEA